MKIKQHKDGTFTAVSGPECNPVCGGSVLAQAPTFLEAMIECGEMAAEKDAKAVTP